MTSIIDVGASDERLIVSEQLHGRRLLLPRTCSDASATSVASDKSACVVCMDLPKNIILSPCNHNHCCLACFRRSMLTTCPMCRVPVESISDLRTGVQLPVNEIQVGEGQTIRPNRIPPTTVPTNNSTRRTSAQGQSIMYNMSRGPQRFLSTTSALAAPPIPVVRHGNGPSERPRIPFSGSVVGPPIAQQAQSSIRVPPLPRSDAHMHIRTAASTRENTSLSLAPQSLPAFLRSAEAEGQSAEIDLSQMKTIVLVGFSRSFIIPLARKLMTIFPPPRDGSVGSHQRSTIFVDGSPVRLVLIDYPSSSDHSELAARVNRHAPNLVLLCADYFDVTSFESVIRLDMEILDYLSIPCHWVLVRSSSAQRTNKSNIVDDSDIRIAKHFFSSSRHCFVVSVDGLKNQGDVTRLSSYIQKHLRHRISTDFASVSEDESQESVPLQQPASILLRWTNTTRARNRERSHQRFSLGNCLNGSSL